MIMAVFAITTEATELKFMFARSETAITIAFDSEIVINHVRNGKYLKEIFKKFSKSEAVKKLETRLDVAIAESEEILTKLNFVAGPDQKQQYLNRTKRNIFTDLEGALLSPITGLASSKTVNQLTSSVSNIEDAEIRSHKAINNISENQKKMSKTLDNAIRVLAKMSRNDNAAYNKIRGLQVSASAIANYQMITTELKQHTENLYMATTNPTNILAILNTDDINKLIEIHRTPATSTLTFPSRTLIENLNTAKTESYITKSRKSFSLNIQVSLPLYDRTEYRISSKVKGDIFLQNKVDTNFVRINTNPNTLLTKHDVVYIIDRQIIFYKTKDTWDQEYNFSTNFKFIKPTILIALEEVRESYVNCNGSKSRMEIEKNSLIHVPLHCSISNNKFIIHPYKVYSHQSIHDNLHYIKFTINQNTTKIQEVIRAQLKPVEELKEVFDDNNYTKNKGRSGVSLAAYILIISAVVTSIPWLAIAIRILCKGRTFYINKGIPIAQ